MGQFVDITGKRFGRLVVTKRHGTDSRGEILWQCKCDCGNQTVTLSSYLRTGHTKSCGCMKGKKPNAKHLKRKYKRIYGIWTNMKTRCTNPKYISYKSYGGKGISVCPEWNDFESFLNWALRSGYSEALTLDRIDNDKGYSPDNCRWANMTEQQNNRTNNHIMTVLGESDTMANMSKKHNVPYWKIQRRLSSGYSDYEAVFGRMKHA